jgi:hypothetical protein
MSEANVNPYNSGDATRQAHRQHQKQKVNSTNEHANALSISTGRTVHRPRAVPSFPSLGTLCM